MRDVLDKLIKLLLLFAVCAGLACNLNDNSIEGSAGSIPSQDSQPDEDPPEAATINYSVEAEIGMGNSISQGVPTLQGELSDFSITPALPAGLTFNTDTGIITGAPTVFLANTTFTVSAEDTEGEDVEASFSLEVFSELTVNNNSTDSDANTANIACDIGDGSCTIRAALEQAVYNNSTGGAPFTKIIVPANTTFDLTAGANPGALTLPGTIGRVVIEGQGDPADTVIDAGGASRVLDANTSFGFLEISNIALINGSTGGFGAGIYLWFTQTTLDNVHLINNDAGDNGGAIYGINATNLVVRNSRFEDNDSGNQGGVVYNIQNSCCTFEDSEFINNTADMGGAFYIPWGHTVRRSTFVGNQATLYGGAIYAFSILTIEDSIFTSNIAFDDGGAIFNPNGGFQLNPIRRCFFGSNSAGFGGGDEGGAIYSSTITPIEIENSTFHNNSARDGGHLRVFNANIRFSTFSNGGSVTSADTIWSNGTVNMESLILDDATGTEHCNGGGTFVDTGNSIEDTVTSSCSLAAGQFNVDASLTGVPTTGPGIVPFLPFSSAASPAVDAGGNCLSEDQNQNARPLGATCDLGAAEQF